MLTSVNGYGVRRAMVRYEGVWRVSRVRGLRCVWCAGVCMVRRGVHGVQG